MSFKKPYPTELPETTTGVYYKKGKGHFATSTDRRIKKDIQLFGDIDVAEDALLSIKLKPAKRHAIHYTGTVIEVLGDASDVDAVVLANHDIPQEFPPEAIAQAEAAQGPTLGNRTDLRDIPLVTIDGADARDFDDAVFAQPTKVNGKKGWHLIVAIADVSHYVPLNSALDEEARLRGNSVYLPGRVVPMLPEALSNGWCSLVPDEDRACVAVHLYVGADGALQNYKFIRGLMRSHKRWTYEQVEETLKSGDAPKYLVHLQQAYKALRRARDKRGALNIHSDELQIVLENRKAVGITARPSLKAHQLIEEFMVLANVAAATALLPHNALYRIHPEPAFDRLEKLEHSLKDLGLKFGLPKDGKVTPHLFNNLLERANSTNFKDYLNLLVLTSQNQARYLPRNEGHFGLGLEAYTHFTSPIRRYSDLVVHRALIDALKLGKGGTQEDLDDLDRLSDDLYNTERRAIKAEREAVNRHVAVYYKDKVGEQFPISVVRVFRHGLIVLFQDTRAEGYIPRDRLPNGRYHFDEDRQVLFNPKNGTRFCMGDKLEGLIAAVDTLTGSVHLEVVQDSVKRNNAPLTKKSVKKKKRKKVRRPRR